MKYDDHTWRTVDIDEPEPWPRWMGWGLAILIALILWAGLILSIRVFWH